MRRLFALTALGLLGAALGCHTAGRCDCEGLLDPCGGPPLPFNGNHHPNGTAKFDGHVAAEPVPAAGTVVVPAPVNGKANGASPAPIPAETSEKPMTPLE